MGFIVKNYYDTDLKRAIKQIAHAFVARRFPNIFVKDKDDLQGGNNGVAIEAEFEKLFLNKLAEVPVSNYEFLRRFVLGQDIAEIASVSDDSPFNDATRDAIFSHDQQYIEVEFHTLLNMVIKGEGFTVKNPLRWIDEYKKRFPAAKKEEDERIKNARRRIEFETAEKRAEGKKAAKIAKEMKAASDRSLKLFMSELKKKDRARYNKLTKLHKIEKKQNSKISALKAKLDESRMMIEHYSALRNTAELTKSEKKKLALAEKMHKDVALKLATTKATIQSQLRLLVTENVITEDYAAIRADQIENVDFTYCALDRWKDACRAGQLPARFKYIITTEDSIENLQKKEHSLTVEKALDDLEVTVEDKMEIYDAQIESDKEIEKTRKEITEARYQRYMNQLKARNPEAYKKLILAHSITKREDAIYERLRGEVEMAERQVAKCNYLIEAGKLVADGPEIREAQLKLAVAQNDLENQELNIKMSVNVNLERGIFSETFKYMRLRQLEMGDFTFHPMDTPEASVNSGQIPCDFAGKDAQEIKTWVRAQRVEYAYEVNVNPTKVNFAELGIEFGHKSKEQHERDFEKVVEHAKVEATAETVEHIAHLVAENDEPAK